MGKNRSNIQINSNDFVGDKQYQPFPQELEWYHDALERNHINLEDSGILDDATEQTNNFINSFTQGDLKQLSQKDGINLLVNQLGVSEDEARKFLKSVEKQGFEFLGTGNFKDMGGKNLVKDDETLDFRIGNQFVSFEKSMLTDLMKGKSYVMPQTVMRHFAKNIPPVMKFYGGRVVFANLDDAKRNGGYVRGTNTIIISGNAFKKGKLTIGDESIPRVKTSSNYKQVLEHELTHRLDYMGGSADIGSQFSNHPYIEHLMNLESSSAYSNKFEFSLKGPTENLAESVKPFAKHNARISDPNRSMSDFIHTDEYSSQHPWWADVGGAVRNAKTPRDLMNYLDKEWEQYLKGNQNVKWE